jgi:hypothetical protein
MPVLFHCHAFGEIAGFIDVTAKLDRNMVGEELKRDDRQHRHHAVGRLRQRDNFVGDSFELFRAVSIGKCNNWPLRALTCSMLLRFLRKDGSHRAQ